MLSQARVQHGLLGTEPSITYRDAAQEPVIVIIMAEGCLTKRIADAWMTACKWLNAPGGLIFILRGWFSPTGRNVIFKGDRIHLHRDCRSV